MIERLPGEDESIGFGFRPDHLLDEYRKHGRPRNEPVYDDSIMARPEIRVDLTDSHEQGPGERRGVK